MESQRVKISGTVLFKTSGTLEVPNVPGVYLIHDLRGVGYIGKSEKLRDRLEYHLRHSWNPQLSAFTRTAVGPLQFSWIVSEDGPKLEKTLVRVLEPRANRVRYVRHEHASIAID
jgi:excinuclease UvrABC nuclease subunit